MARKVDGQLRMPGLSLKVRGRGRRGPDLASFRFGALTSHRFELDVDTDVTVQLLGPDGELISSMYGTVDGVGFKRHRPAQGKPWIERLHSITLEAQRQEEES